MKIKILIITTICILPIKYSYPVTCLGFGACDTSSDQYGHVNANCGLGTRYDDGQCYIEDGTENLPFVIHQCDCPAGYTPRISQVLNCDNITHVSGCDCICSNCTSDTTWTATSAGYQRHTLRSCNCASGKATCQTSYEYRCAAGYYGHPATGTSGCTQCPPVDAKLSTKQYGTSTPGNNRTITDCYLAPGTYYDTTGTFKISGGNCQYSN